MAWEIDFHPHFDVEFNALSEVVQEELLAIANALIVLGPTMGRPRADI
jgi:hypothetical protein